MAKDKLHSPKYISFLFEDSIVSKVLELLTFPVMLLMRNQAQTTQGRSSGRKTRNYRFITSNIHGRPRLASISSCCNLKNYFHTVITSVTIDIVAFAERHPNLGHGFESRFFCCRSIDRWILGRTSGIPRRFFCSGG